jgi:hypothetical protein
MHQSILVPAAVQAMNLRRLPEWRRVWSSMAALSLPPAPARRARCEIYELWERPHVGASPTTHRACPGLCSAPSPAPASSKHRFGCHRSVGAGSFSHGLVRLSPLAVLAVPAPPLAELHPSFSPWAPALLAPRPHPSYLQKNRFRSTRLHQRLQGSQVRLGGRMPPHRPHRRQAQGGWKAGNQPQWPTHPCHTHRPGSLAPGPLVTLVRRGTKLHASA